MRGMVLGVERMSGVKALGLGFAGSFTCFGWEPWQECEENWN